MYAWLEAQPEWRLLLEAARERVQGACLVPRQGPFDSSGVIRLLAFEVQYGPGDGQRQVISQANADGAWYSVGRSGAWRDFTVSAAATVPAEELNAALLKPLKLAFPTEYGRTLADLLKRRFEQAFLAMPEAAALSEQVRSEVRAFAGDGRGASLISDAFVKDAERELREALWKWKGLPPEEMHRLVDELTVRLLHDV